MIMEKVCWNYLDAIQKVEWMGLKNEIDSAPEKRLAKAKHIKSMALKGPTSISVQKAHLAFVSSIVFNQ